MSEACLEEILQIEDKLLNERQSGIIDKEKIEEEFISWLEQLYKIERENIFTIVYKPVFIEKYLNLRELIGEVRIVNLMVEFYFRCNIL